MESSSPKTVPAWQYRFVDGMRCLMCGESDRQVVASLDRDDLGICERCVVVCYRAWHEVPADALPVVPTEGSGERVRVLVVRLRELSGGGTARPEVPESYEVAMVRRPDGGLDLPAADVEDGRTLVEAAAKALEPCGMRTWGPCVEPLYSALSPRGKLVRVALATAYTTWVLADEGGVRSVKADTPVSWQEWPPWRWAPEVSPLLVALRDVLPSRLWRYSKTEPRASSLTVQVRRAASEYLLTRQEVRAGRKADTSGLEILRRNTSPDELLVDKLVADHEQLAAELREQKRAEQKKIPEAPPPPPDLDLAVEDSPEEGETPESPGSIDEAFEGEPGEPGGDDT